MAKQSSDASSGKLEIPQIKRMVLTVPIVGTMPLITNRIPDHVADQLQAKVYGEEPEKIVLSRDEVLRQAIHWTHDGRPAFPGSGIKKALVSAGGRFAGQVMTHLRGGLYIADELVAIEGPEPYLRRDTGRNRQGNLVVCLRPCWPEWRMTVRVAYLASMFTTGDILNLFSLAGFAVGFGCWRPELDGPFGTFGLDMKRK